MLYKNKNFKQYLQCVINSEAEAVGSTYNKHRETFI